MVGAGPLTGVRVVEIGGGLPAAFCTRLLAGYGADTVRVEGLPGVVDQLGDDEHIFYTSGRKRITLHDIETAADLVATADVLVEDQGPGFLAELGIDPAECVGSSQVVTSISPLGRNGPRSRWQTTNAVQFALGGLMTLTGEPFRPPLVTGGDQAFTLGGLHAFAATAVALTGWSRSGSGAHIDLSMQETAASMPELYGPMSEYELGEPVPRAGNSVRACWGVYRCADGFAGVCCLDRQAGTFLSLIGEPVAGDPRFADAIGRAEHNDELLAHVMSFISDHTKDELSALSPIHRVPFGAVRTPLELLHDEAFIERGFFDRVHTAQGLAVMPGRPFPGLGWTSPAQSRSDDAPAAAPWDHDPIPTPPAPTPSPGATSGEAGPSGSVESGVGPSTRPLHGLRILDLTMMWAGPYATKLLAESGAEVIKIESPGAWDNIRTLVPQDPEIVDPWNSAYYFNEYNHSKKSLTLDLAQEEGRDIFLRLVATADVVIENYRADVLDNLGLGYETLREANDRIVLVSMAGFGKTGPLKDHVGFGPIIEMMSGLMSLTGYLDDDVPYKTGISFGDPVGGTNAGAAVALAILQRDRTGCGCHIDLAQRETASSMAGPAFVAASLRNETPTARGNRHRDLVPQGVYPARGEDRWLVLSVRSQREWERLATIIGLEDWAGLPIDERRARHDEIDEAITRWSSGRSADEGAETLQAVGIPAGEVIDTVAIHDDPQLTARNFYRVVPNPKMRPYRQSGPTWAIGGPPPHEMKRSPWFGEHNEEILGALELSPAQIERLRVAGVIADAPINPGVG